MNSKALKNRKKLREYDANVRVPSLKSVAKAGHSTRSSLKALSRALREIGRNMLNSFRDLLKSISGLTAGEKRSENPNPSTSYGAKAHRDKLEALQRDVEAEARRKEAARKMAENARVATNVRYAQYQEYGRKGE